MNLLIKYYSRVAVAGSLAVLSAQQAGATDTFLPLRHQQNGVYLHGGGLTSQTIESSFGTNVMGLAFTGTTTYDFYSPPLTNSVSMVPSDKGGGMIYMRNTSTTSANDFSVSGRMQYFDYDPATGTETLIVDTTASPPKDCNHGQIVNWAIPNALLPANYTMPAGHLLHVAMTVGLISGTPGNFGEVLIDGPKNDCTVAYLAQNRSVVLVWPFGPVAPSIVSIEPMSDPAMQLSCIGTPGNTYVIEATTNLTVSGSWLTISTNTAGTNGLFQFIDTDSVNYNCRFYRFKTQ